MTFQRRMIALLILLWLPLAFSAWAETYDANAGTTHAYPTPATYKDSKGKGKATEFHLSSGKVHNADLYFPNEGKTHGYPQHRRVAEAKGTARATTFNHGQVQYPANYYNPIDAKPMVVHERQRRRVVPKEPNLPDNVCPLHQARKKFNQANRMRRERIFERMLVQGEVAVVQAKVRDWSTPVLALGGLRLVQTHFDPLGHFWEADLYFPAAYRCGKGIVRVRQDDSLTSNVSVLAIDRDLVLLVVNGRLAYLKTPQAVAPTWRMVWDTGIELEYETGQASGLVIDKSPSRTKPKKRSKKKRRKSRKSKSKRSIRKR